MFKPTRDRVLVKRREAEETTKAGIILTEKEKPFEGTVVAVGSGLVLENGETRAIAVKEGDVVTFGKYCGVEVTVDDETMLILREDDILGISEQTV